MINFFSGPISYVDRNDSFIVANSSFCLESFKYQNLAVAGESGGRGRESQEVSHGRRISADWSVGVGEPVLQIQVIRSMDKEEPATIILLTRY